MTDTKTRIYRMKLGGVYRHYVARAERRGRTKDEVDEVICWLTGYSREELAKLMNSDINVKAFYTNAPGMNPNRSLIKGVVCGIRVEEIEDPVIRDARYLDKLIDELARGRKMDKILRQ